MYLPVSATGRVPVDAAGQPVLLRHLPPTDVVVQLSRWSALLLDDVAAFGTPQDATFFADQPEILKAITLVRNRREMIFDPASGEKLDYSDGGVVGRNPRGRLVFPRLDPAVIGMVQLRGTNKILLARNRQRDGYFSLIAGYVDAGETLEQAFAREVWEETGRRVEDLQYWGSQPWPPSGSLMVGFTAVTDDAAAVGKLDGELAEIRWVSRDELPELPLARAGSIAHTMIMEWYHGE